MDPGNRGMVHGITPGSAGLIGRGANSVRLFVLIRANRTGILRGAQTQQKDPLMRNTRTLTISALAAAVLLASGCSNYVKREDYDAVVSELRSRDSSLQSQIDANKSAIEQLRSSLEARLSAHEAQIQQLAGRLHVDMNVHFAYDSADLREQDRGTLDAFSQVINGHHPNAHITVEGFTDAAGNAAYNQRLGQRRADAVRDYLVSTGLGADRVTAVSYGEERKRQLSPGAWGDNGLANRRVTLVVDLPPVS